MRSQSGQITIFLCIILLAVFILAGVLIDASRISSSEAIVKSAVTSAAKSALANYSSRLKENYGIFALADKSNEELCESIKEYISKNLMIKENDSNVSKGINLHQFKIEKISVTPIMNLSEDEVFKQQILEYMKYRAPKEIVDGFFDKLKIFKDTGKISSAYKKKVNIDKILGNIDKSQQSLKKSIEGTGISNECYINGFNKDSSWTTAFNQYISLYNSKGKTNDMKNEVNPIINMWNNIRYKMTSGYVQPIENAVELVNKISVIGSKADQAINELEQFISENFKENGTFTNTFVVTIISELKKLKALILSGKQAATLINKLNNNIIILEGLTEKLDMINNIVSSSQSDSSSFNNVSKELINMAENYSNNLSYIYEKPEKSGNKNDPRKGIIEELKEYLQKGVANDRNYKDEGIIENELPSRRKVVSKTFESEDAPYIINKLIKRINKTVEANQASYNGDLNSIADNADLYNENGNFQEDALGYISDIGDILSGDITKFRDNIYINEYIMDNFKNAVPALKRNGIKNDKNTLYEGEVEYILHGNASENTNELMTKAQIFLIRLGLNTLHVYTDAKKRELAEATAAAVTGWWTGGAGIPIVSNLIMCGWAVGESMIDIKDLINGKSVPIYKSQGDWKLDIGLPKDISPRADEKLCFNYNDYLRLLLLTMNEKEKLGRMEDLIQMNIVKVKPGFVMSHSNTCIRVEAEVSINNLFISGERRRIKVLTYESY